MPWKPVDKMEVVSIRINTGDFTAEDAEKTKGRQDNRISNVSSPLGGED